MASSEGKPKKGQQFTNLIKGAKSIVRQDKSPALASSSSRGASVAAEIAQQKSSSASEVKSVKDDSELLPAFSSSTLNATGPTVTEEVRIAIQSETDIVQIRELQEVSVGGENALSTNNTLGEATSDHGIHEDMTSLDTARTLERFKKAIERITKALELRRDSWETFELSEFHSLPLGAEQDIVNLQLQINKVLESRMNTSRNRTKWGKSKHILEQIFRALAPFMKNMLSAGINAAQVSVTVEISE